MRRLQRNLRNFIGLVFLLSACSNAGGGIEVKDAWARPADAGGNSAVYFEIENGGLDDNLLSAASMIAERTELHRSIVDPNGNARMEHQDRVEVPNGTNISFAPGGLHVMLINLNQILAVGDRFDLIFNFENMGEVTINVPVQVP